MQVNIIGNGVVGNTLVNWINRNKPRIKINICDPPLGFKEHLKGNVSFIAVPVPVKGLNQDLSILEEAVLKTKIGTIVFIRSTVLPGTCDMLAKKYDRLICSMPEFLTERRAQLDFNNNDITYVGYPKDATTTDKELIKSTIEDVIGFRKSTILLENTSCELGKYMHNNFGAMKVTYFNIMHHLCERDNINFEQAKSLIFNTGFINHQHTQVPGPDDRLGYGGKCFLDNIDSFIGYCGTDLTGTFFRDIHLINKYFRYSKDDKKDLPL